MSIVWHRRIKPARLCGKTIIQFRETRMLRKVKISSIALYGADRENCVRSYIKCVDDKTLPQPHKFTIIGFFTKAEKCWAKDENENCTLENILSAMNGGIELLVEIKESRIATLYEGEFVFGK